MQLLVGKLGTWSHDDSNRVGEKLASIYGNSGRVLSNESGFVRYLEGESQFLYGIAESVNCKVLIYGAIHSPLQGWVYQESPQDLMGEVAGHVLKNYIECGDGITGLLTGSYVCCVFDQARGRAIAFSDEDGLRNLYVHEDRLGGLWFGTNPRSLALSGPQGIHFDRSLEDFFLAYGFYPFGRTMYHGITTLPPTTLSEVTRGNVKLIQKSEKPKQKYPDLEAATEHEASKALYETFMQAVSDQCTVNERVAVLLGGVDSALVASALRRLGKNVETFSFYYEESRFNQPHTDTLTAAIGTRHHWVPITSQDIAKGHLHFAEVFTQPTNWANYPIQTARICNVIKDRGISFVYTGDGCDGVFMGYPNVHKRSAAYGSVVQIPKWLTQFLLRTLDNAALEYHTGRVYTLACGILRTLQRSGAGRLLLTFKVMDEFSLRRLRLGQQPPQELSVEQIILKIAKKYEQYTPDRIAYAGKSLVSPNKNKMNGCMDQFGIFLFSPYLHPNLKSFAQGLPDKFLRPKNLSGPKAKIGKYLLLKMIEKNDLLPGEIVYQPKVAAVDGPIDRWYHRDIRATMFNVLKDLPFEANPKYIKFLLREHRLDNFYKRRFSSDEVTSHTLSLLATYASFAKNIPQT